MKLIGLLLLLGLQGCAHSDPWTTRDTAMQTGITILLAVDAIQTANIQYNPLVEEVGFARHFLGAQPSTTDTYLYFATSAVVSFAIARALPAKWRPWFQGGSMVRQAHTIYGNCQHGATFCTDSTGSRFQ